MQKVRTIFTVLTLSFTAWLLGPSFAKASEGQAGRRSFYSLFRHYDSYEQARRVSFLANRFCYAKDSGSSPVARATIRKDPTVKVRAFSYGSPLSKQCEPNI